MCRIRTGYNPAGAKARRRWYVDSCSYSSHSKTLSAAVPIKHLESCTVLIKTSTCLQSLLFSEDQELARISGKVDRAFERLRRVAVKSLDSLSTDTSRTEVKAFVVSCVDLLQKLAVSAARKSDIITRALDSLFVLARTTLNVQDPRTYVPAFEHLGGAVSILDSVPQDADVDHALHFGDILQHFRITLSSNAIWCCSPVFT